MDVQGNLQQVNTNELKSEIILADSELNDVTDQLSVTRKRSDKIPSIIQDQRFKECIDLILSKCYTSKQIYDYWLSKGLSLNTAYRYTTKCYQYIQQQFVEESNYVRGTIYGILREILNNKSKLNDTKSVLATIDRIIAICDLDHGAQTTNNQVNIQFNLAPNNSNNNTNKVIENKTINPIYDATELIKTKENNE